VYKICIPSKKCPLLENLSFKKHVVPFPAIVAGAAGLPGALCAASNAVLVDTVNVSSTDSTVIVTC
jgi:hypothetical protein